MYKIILNNEVIDVVQFPKFVRFLRKGHITMTDKSSAQGIIGSDGQTVYSFKPISGKNFKVVSIVKISSDKELSRLQDLLSSGETVSADETALAKAKQSKIASLSSQCKSIITAGFVLELSNGENSSFKLTIEDQLNLMLIETRINAGDTTFIYHATNQPCKFYTREDMQKIVSSFRRHVQYHTTYFNVAKQYINSLTDIRRVTSFMYGDSVLDAADNTTIKQILINGGVN